MHPATTILFNGIAGAVADVALNDLSRATDVAHLRTYFAHRSILGAAAAAAVTVMLGAAAVLLVTHLCFGFAVPRNLVEGGLTLATSFLIGYAMDVAIARLNVFGNDLRVYYKHHGAGGWGGLSLVVSMAVALVMQGLVLPRL